MVAEELLPSSFSLSLLPSGFGGDGVKNAVNEGVGVFYVGFDSHVWGGSGAKHVKNCSY